jgi:hypothetical protein
VLSASWSSTRSGDKAQQSADKFTRFKFNQIRASSRELNLERILAAVNADDANLKEREYEAANRNWTLLIYWS